MERTRGLALGDLFATTERPRVIGDPTTRFTGIAYDLRSVQPGDLFAVIPHASFRGSAFVEEALSRGAAALLVSEPLAIDFPQFVANDILAALPAVAARFYDHPARRLRMIGVTGTDGKTTTTTLIDAILRAAGEITGFISTVAVRIGADVQTNATHLTTPEAVDIQRMLREMVSAGAGWGILEATSQGLDLHRLDGIAFQIAAVTNISPEHLDFHETFEAYLRAKGRLFQQIAPAGGVAVINIDDAGAREMLAYVGEARVIRYSPRGQEADVRAGAIELDDRETRFELLMGDGSAVTRMSIQLPLPGRFNVANALCAAAVSLAAGIPIEAIKRGLEAPIEIPGRMTRIDSGQPFTVLVDFAHTPAAVERVLEHLSDLHPLGRRIALFGGSGGSRLRKLPAVAEILARLADFAVLTTDNPHKADPEQILALLAQGAEAGGGRLGETYSVELDRREAIRHALSLAQPGDSVLLAGMGHEPIIVWGDRVIPWNETEVAYELLDELGYSRRDGSQRETADAALSSPAMAGAEPSTTARPRISSVSDLFHPAHPPLSSVQSPDLRTIIVTGDIVLSEPLHQLIDRPSSLVTSPLSDLMRDADLTLAACEGTLGGEPLSWFAAALKGSGIDLIAIAGESGDSRARFEAARICCATEQRMAVREVRGLRIGTVVIEGVGRPFDRAVITDRIARGRAEVDLLLVVARWGKRWVSLPEADADSAPDDPRAIGHLAVELGADLVVGSHPGCVQGVEHYQDKLIAYSHGCVIAAPEDNPLARQAVIGRYTFDDRTLVSVEYVPVIVDNSLPRLADAAEAAPILRRMEGASIMLELGI